MHANYQGKKIYYEVHGKGACITLLHGFMEDNSIWNNLLPLLSQYRVIVLDLPGHSKSEVLGLTHTPEETAAVIWQILSAEGIRETTLIGHSLGGYVALEMARLEPTRVKGICMLHSTALPDSDIKKKERDRVIKVLELSPAVFIREAIPNLFAPDLKEKFTAEIHELTGCALGHPVKGLIATSRGMRDRRDGLPWLRETNVRVHYIIGKKDPVIPFDSYNDQLNAGPHVTSFVSETAGHMGFLEDRDAVFASILSFCNTVS